MTISAMAIFRFPVEIGESNEWDIRLNAILSPGVEEELTISLGDEARDRNRIQSEKLSAICTALNIYSESGVQFISD